MGARWHRIQAMEAILDVSDPEVNLEVPQQLVEGGTMFGHVLRHFDFEPRKPSAVTRWTPGGNVVVGLLLLVTMVVYDDSA